MIGLYNGLRVLITGGCGFIGSHLAHRLVELGAHVTILDDLSSGTLANIEAISHKVTVITKSITDYQACLEATKNIAVVFHLAAFISVPQSLENPTLCADININGTANMLEAARINNVERFVFSSSAAVYGRHEGVCVESMACHPESPYGYSKLIGELLCQQYAKNFSLNTVCLRYFNVYGERQNPHGQYAAVRATFKHRMLHNLPITIFGDGLQTRDFVPVEKVVDANLQLAMLDPHLMRGAAFNIATGHSISLLDLIDALRLEFPYYNAAISFAASRPGDVQHSAADCRKYMHAIATLPAFFAQNNEKSAYAH
jgi:nucleoside-diphosphate-sugar epimerase